MLQKYYILPGKCAGVWKARGSSRKRGGKLAEEIGAKTISAEVRGRFAEGMRMSHLHCRTSEGQTFNDYGDLIFEHVDIDIQSCHGFRVDAASSIILLVTMIVINCL